MNDPQVVSPDEWRAARRQLLAKEKEFTRQRDALNAERRRLPMVEVVKPYLFEGKEGEVSLLDLFEGRSQLLVYHFMFDPSWDQGCPSCSFLVDNIGHLSHLHARDTTLALVSRAPVAKIEPYRQRMGWAVPWYSSFGSDFNYDFHVTLDVGEMHGISAFLRRAGRVFHTYSATRAAPTSSWAPTTGST